MLKSIRNIAVIALAAGLMWHCGGERVTQSQTETTGPPLGKLTASDSASQAVAMVNLTRDGAPVSGAIVEFSRSIAGRSASYQWSGITDAMGRARVEIASANVTGYYRARALQDRRPAGLGGSISRIGSWSSIPINSGYEVMLNLPIGGKACVTASSKIMSEIPIGLVVSLTGSLTSTGIPINNGFELAREEVNRASLLNGPRIRFIIEDDQSTAEGAIAAFNKLIDQNVSVVLGPFTSTMAAAIFPIAQEHRVVAISPTSNAPGLSAIGDFVFRTSLPVDRLLPNGIATTQQALGYRRVATIHDKDDVFSQGSDAAFKKAFRDNGVEVLISETFQTGDTDFSAQLTRIKAANPDAISISALPTEIPEIMIQGRQLGIPFEIPFICPTLVMGEVQRAGDAAEGAITIALWSEKADTPGNRAFIDNYRAKFGGEPDAFTAQAYTAVHLLGKAIADAQSTEASAIRDALSAIRDVPTVLGNFSFDGDGDGIHNAITLTVKNGKFEVFDP